MEIFKIEKLGEYVNILNIPEDWINHYDEAVANFCSDWLNEEAFNGIIRFYQFDVEFKLKFRDVWNMVNEDVNLNFLVYLWYYILYMVDLEKRNKWDFNLDYFRDRGSLYMPMISLLMGYKIHEKAMKDYDLDQIEQQKRIIRYICMSDDLVYGIKGMRFSNMEWGSRFVRGQIVQIGILQYEFKKNYLNGEDVIFMHIPRTKYFTKENIDRSIENRNKVFNYFKVSRDVFFVTYTWLLSPELKEVLDSKSNIIYFQKKFMIVKVKEEIGDFLKFVFNKALGIDDYGKLEENTQIQRYFKKKILNKEKLHIGLGILK